MEFDKSKLHRIASSEKYLPVVNKIGKPLDIYILRIVLGEEDITLTSEDHKCLEGYIVKLVKDKNWDGPSPRIQVDVDNNFAALYSYHD